MYKSQKYLILLIFLSLITLSQEDRDTRGRDFWLTYMPNVHIASTNDEAQFLDQRDSLYIFVASDFPTTVTIDYKNQDGQEFSEVIEIEDVLEYSTFKVAWSGFELPDNFSGISEQVFHITSDEDITVIAHNQAKWSSDGMIVYPTKTLGNHYFINSFPSYRNAGTTRSSQFAVVAIEDETTIEIEAKTNIIDWDNLSNTITLDKGQTYLFQADLPIGTISGADLTGSEVRSDKPISVFSGSERAYLPIVERGSKDYLTAQMIPVESMGREYHLLPFVSVSEDELSNYPDYYRVVGIHDNTEIYVDGQFVDIINKGEHYTGGISSRGIFLETSKSSSVYQLKRSTNDGFNDQISAIGDPFMLLNIPQTQYKESYKVINFQSNEFVGFFGFGNTPSFREVYEEQYINIAIEQDYINTIFFDFQPFNASGLPIEWEAIPASNYVWTRIPVEIGTHTITADIPFICYAYGYGPANSYGFVCGGINMKLLDHNPPEVSQIETECGVYRAVVSDENYLDSGIDRIEITSSSNVDVEFDNEGDSLRSRDYNVILQDEYNDGFATITSYDEFGMWVRDTVAIPGFTVALTNASENAIIETPDEFQLGSSNTYQFQILNYGDFNVQINNIIKDDKLEILSPQIPFEITPGEVVDLIVRYVNSGNIEFIKGDISLAGICSERSLITVDIETWFDENPPEVSSLDFQMCDPEFRRGYTVAISDEGQLESGLSSVEIFQQNNVIIQEIENNEQRYIADIYLEDPFQSGYVFYIARDVFGNANDEISFFIEPIDIVLDIDQEVLDVGSVLNGFVKCKEFTLTNNSDFEIEINNLSLEQNLNFSVPQSQFPIYLNPGESTEIQVCFDDMGQNITESIDIADLIIEDCLRKELELKALIFEYNSEGNSRCDLDLQFALDQIPPQNFVENPRPNPTSSISKIFIGLEENSNVSVNVFNFFGVSYGKILEDDLQAGLFELNVDGSELESGQYQLMIQIDDEIFVEKLIIQK